ncbi:hypothetical protein [Staphylococcus phage APTC_SA_12]|nr:MAG: hypothetical protein [Staphylococcus phage RP2]UPO38532.1 hypothetical protein [Staphylococcus phage vB_SaS_GE1]UWV20064.1 hypothetical protein [Staphylococcus phage APTC_SA_2]UWV20300.1 hypothetical protein [Staphylococcus phage APTC_SA_4]UWV20475.1 hypothetical protein [Staphylococcus phage APTC_SA_12]UWV20649.1 hypothetical protein [Staphylococcus phage APTC_SA_13]WMT38769.1 hypothetical protein [Staphylococcus phage Sp2021]WPH67140.1 hypothetical protein CUBB_gp224 [Staphylococcu
MEYSLFSFKSNPFLIIFLYNICRSGWGLSLALLHFIYYSIVIQKSILLSNFF